MDREALPQELAALDPGVLDSSILTAYRGSRAHGMWVDPADPNSIGDLDVMAFCVPPESYYLGLDQYGSGGTKEIKHNEWDVVIYEARKAIRLLENGNPNVLSMLWVPDEFILHETEEGAQLRRQRGAFRGRHVYQ